MLEFYYITMKYLMNRTLVLDEYFSGMQPDSITVSNELKYHIG